MIGARLGLAMVLGAAGASGPEPGPGGGAPTAEPAAAAPASTEPTTASAQPRPQPAGRAPAATPRSRGVGPLDAAQTERRHALVEALQAAEALAVEDPEAAEPALLQALGAFADAAPLVADDAYAQSTRVYAQLALARTYLVLDRPQAATEAIDAALRAARGDPLPAVQFGPSLAALHDQRAAVLAGREPATLTVRCVAPCLVLVDERPFESGPLPAGHHRVWIEAHAPGQPVLRRQIEPAPGEAVTLEYDVIAPPEPEPPQPQPTPTPPPAAPPRLLPRWATVLGLALGTAVVGVGGALVAVDHRCPDLGDPRQVPCLRILNTDVGGFVLVGLGGAAMIGSAVVLSIDEVRLQRRRRRAARSRAR